MSWLVDLDGDPASRSIAEHLRRAYPALEPARLPEVGSGGVVLCSRPSPELDRLLGTAAGGPPGVVIVTGVELDPWPLLAAGAVDVLVWEGDAAPVVARLERLRLIDELVGSAGIADVIRGSSPALRETLRDLVTAARFGNGPLLILGETGTGKELAARVAHQLSPVGSTGNLVVVDCTTIVPTLSGSELFGHERGAFTGAVNVRTGAFAAANGGTLMLDEVGELPLELQPELLRVVQEGTYKRVGSDSWQTTRFRLVCATHRNLEDDVAAGRFRADFYYRIAASVVRMPPLRERGDDVLPLFRSFVAEAAGSAMPVRVSAVVERVLRARSYPGNLRDLRQLAHRVAARHVGPGPVTPGDLAESDRPDRERSPAAASAPGPAEGVLPQLADAVRAQLAAGRTLRELREQVAELAVQVTLDECGGNVRAAASRLGVTDRALHLRRAQTRESADPSSATNGSRVRRESSE